MSLTDRQNGMNAESKTVEPDAEIRNVNRRLAIVKAIHPYFEWAQSVSDTMMKFTLEDLRRNPTAWLLPIGEKPDDFLRREYCVIFLHELSEICGTMSLWPDKRTFEKFQDWFEIEIIHSIHDLDDRPLKSNR